MTELFQLSSSKQELEQKALELVHVLQSTLDIERLIEIFGDGIATLVPHDGLMYKNPAENLRIGIGERTGYSFDYRLVLFESPLGEVSLTRKSQFASHEIQQLESLLCALVYPLHNALLYRRAVQAALKDPVTGISNRAAMDSMLRREIDLAHRHRNPLSLVMLDADRFKLINDTYGHIVGDAVLRGLGQRLSHCVRRSDIVFRYGGEEFVVVLSNTQIAGASSLAERIRQALERKVFRYDDVAIKLTASLGVACLQEGEDAKSLLGRADRALYRAKAQGRNRVASEMSGIRAPHAAS